MINKLVKSKSDRTRLLLTNVIASLGIKCANIIISIIMIPLTIGYISSELYGIWITLYSIIQWTSFFDIGFGNGLKNKLAESLAKGDYAKGRSYVSTTYFFMIFVFGLLSIIGYLICPLINWASIFKISSVYNLLLINVVRIVIVCFSLQMIFKVLSNVIYAYQRNAWASFLDVCAQLISLISIYTMTVTVSPSLENIAFVFSVSPFIVYLLGSIYLYNTKFKLIAPSFKFVNRIYARDIFSLGGKFFIIQFAFIIIYQTVNVLISRIAGPIYVTQYNIAYQYLSISAMIFSIFLAPLWPAITDAYTKGDSEWMNNLYAKMLKLFVLCVLVVVIMTVVSPFIYKYWIGQQVSVELLLTSLVAIYTLLNIWNSFHSTILNGMGKVVLQLYTSLFGSFAIIPLALFFGHKWEVYGILLAMILLAIPSAVISRIQVKELLKMNALGVWNK